LAIEPDDLPPELRTQEIAEDSGTETLLSFLQRWLDARLKQTPALPYRDLHDEVEAALCRISCAAIKTNRAGSPPSVG